MNISTNTFVFFLANHLLKIKAGKDSVDAFANPNKNDSSENREVCAESKTMDPQGDLKRIIEKNFQKDQDMNCIFEFERSFNNVELYSVLNIVISTDENLISCKIGLINKIEFLPFIFNIEGKYWKSIPEGKNYNFRFGGKKEKVLEFIDRLYESELIKLEK